MFKIIRFLAYALIGMVCATSGIGVADWRFWALLISAVVCERGRMFDS